MENKKQYASKHYAYYPKGEIPIYLAYGFRPILLILAPYIIVSIILWSLSFSGFINLSFIENPLNWHMYEMIFGIGFAGIIAFFLTGVPEMFPGSIPVVGKKLFYIVFLWVLGRVSFWFMDFIGVFLVAILNISLTITPLTNNLKS